MTYIYSMAQNFNGNYRPDPQRPRLNSKDSGVRDYQHLRNILKTCTLENSSYGRRPWPRLNEVHGSPALIFLERMMMRIRLCCERNRSGWEAKSRNGEADSFIPMYRSEALMMLAWTMIHTWNPSGIQGGGGRCADRVGRHGSVQIGEARIIYGGCFNFSRDKWGHSRSNYVDSKNCANYNTLLSS